MKHLDGGGGERGDVARGAGGLRRTPAIFLRWERRRGGPKGGLKKMASNWRYGGGMGLLQAYSLRRRFAGKVTKKMSRAGGERAIDEQGMLGKKKSLKPHQKLALLGDEKAQEVRCL